MLERLISAIEKIAGLFLLAVATLTFVMVILRKFFDTGIPDWFDFSRLLQGMAIFWGIACTCYRGGHINVDLLWDLSGTANRRRIDAVAYVCTIVFIVAFAALAMQAAIEMRGKNLLTSDLRIPQWGFYLVAALGIVASAAATVARRRAQQRDPAGALRASDETPAH